MRAVGAQGEGAIGHLNAIKRPAVRRGNQTEGEKRGTGHERLHRRWKVRRPGTGHVIEDKCPSVLVSGAAEAARGVSIIHIIRIRDSAGALATALIFRGVLAWTRLIPAIFAVLPAPFIRYAARAAMSAALLSAILVRFARLALAVLVLCGISILSAVRS